MKKAILARALMGFPMGIAIGQGISLLVSAILGGGAFQACVPSFVTAVGSELGAVALQTLLCGILGAASAASSLVWAADWSLLKRTVVNFLLLTGAMLPIAYVTGWMEHSVKGFLLYFAAFTLIFALIWLCQYLALKRRIKKINQKMQSL